MTASRQTTDGVTYGNGTTDNLMTYTYNLASALVEQQYPSGRVVKNVLDNNGDLSIVQSKKNQAAGFFTYADSFTYNAAGAVTSMQLGNGRWESTQFNSRLQPVQIALGATRGTGNLLKLDYSYGTTANNGNVQSQTITVPTVGANTGFVAVQNYNYDSLNRLKDATENVTPNGGSASQSWKQTFTFDRYGNRRFDAANTTTIPQGCAETVCNPQVDAATNKLIGYQFDASGNTKQDAENRKFTYDAENKQTKVETVDQSGNPVSTIGQYFYDGDGKRVKKIVPSTGETTVFVTDASAKLVAEYSTVVTPPQDAKVSYLTNDHLGSPRITTDQNGNVASRRDFMPYGEEIFSPQRTQALGYTADTVRQKFTAYERDIESDLDFAEARYYNPAHGRFTGIDPLLESAQPSLPQTWNRYAYCLNNPLNAVDPTGMMTDFVNEQTGQRSRIEDGRDQVLVASTDTINLYFKTWNENRDMYFAGLSLLEKNENANLHLTTSEFTARVQTTYGESSAFRMNAGEELSNEMKAIAYVNQRNGVAYGDKSPQGLDYKNTSIDKETDKMKLGNLAVVNQVRGGPDPSNGATGWDGREQALFPDKDKRASVPDGRGGSWNLRKNTGGWSISDADYAKWKQNVGRAFKAPQYSPASTGRNKGQVRYYSTAVYGNTIFWRIQ